MLRDFEVGTNVSCDESTVSRLTGLIFPSESRLARYHRSFSSTCQARIKVGIGPVHCTTIGPIVSHLSPLHRIAELYVFLDTKTVSVLLHFCFLLYSTARSLPETDGVF